MPLYPPVLAGKLQVGLGPVLSVHSKQPAAYSTLPKLRCSLAAPLPRMLLPLMLPGLTPLFQEQNYLPELVVTEKTREKVMTLFNTKFLLQ